MPLPIVNSFAYQGVPYTVDRMRKLTLGALRWEQSLPLRQLAEDILAKVRAKDPVSEVAATHYWMIANWRYVLDPQHVELLKSPLISLAKRPSDIAAGRRANQGDCDEGAEAEAALNMVTGKKASFFTISTVRGRDHHHVFTGIEIPSIPGLTLIVDPIPGPNTTSMLRSVVSWKKWPVEPLRLPGGGWGVAGRPQFEGVGPLPGMWRIV